MGAGIDASLGLALFWKHYREHKWQQTPVYVMAVLIVLLVFTGSFTEFNSFNMASGVYRTKDLPTQEDSKVIYHKDGKTIMIEETYVNGELQGPYMVYYRNRNITKSANYENGKLHGNFKQYSDVGVLTDDLNYVNGLLDGEATYYEPNGRIKKKGIYRQDLKVGIWQ